MNKQTQALKLALELLDKQWQCTQVWSLEEALDVADNIREALAEQPEQQQEQIVAWITNSSLYGLRRTNKKTVVVHREKTKVARIPVLIKEDA